MSKKYFYGFQFTAGKKTTCGNPHPRTGRLSIAGKLVVFQSKQELAEWIDWSTKRIAVNLKQARDLHLGLTDAEWREELTELRVVSDLIFEIENSNLDLDQLPA